MIMIRSMQLYYHDIIIRFVHALSKHMNNRSKHDSIEVEETPKSSWVCLSVHNQRLIQTIKSKKSRYRYVVYNWIIYTTLHQAMLHITQRIRHPSLKRDKKLWPHTVLCGICIGHTKSKSKMNPFKWLDEALDKTFTNSQQFKVYHKNRRVYGVFQKMKSHDVGDFHHTTEMKTAT